MRTIERLIVALSTRTMKGTVMPSLVVVVARSAGRGPVGSASTASLPAVVR